MRGKQSVGSRAEERRRGSISKISVKILEVWVHHNQLISSLIVSCRTTSYCDTSRHYKNALIPNQPADKRYG